MSEVAMCRACGGVYSEDCGQRKNAIDQRQPIPCAPVSLALWESERNRPQPEGLETTAEDRAQWAQTIADLPGGMLGSPHVERLLRDFDRLLSREPAEERQAKIVAWLRARKVPEAFGFMPAHTDYYALELADAIERGDFLPEGERG